MESTGGRYFIALHCDVAVYALDHIPGRVWQYSSVTGRDAAIDYLVTKTTAVEMEGGRMVGEPTEFDLSPAAIAEFHPNDPGEWLYAPTLYDELLTGIKDPPAFPAHVAVSVTSPRAPKVGDIWYEIEATTLSTWSGTSWIKAG